MVDSPSPSVWAGLLAGLLLTADGTNQLSSEQQSAPRVLAIDAGPLGRVELVGVEPIADPDCDGKTELAIRTELGSPGLLQRLKFVTDSKVQSTGDRRVGYLLKPDGQSLNAFALQWGCARLSPGPLDRRVELENASRSAQTFNRGYYSPAAAQARAARESTRSAASGGATSATRTQEGAPLGQWNGSGSKDTESFAVPATEWRIVWVAIPSTSTGALMISVHDAETLRLVNTISSGVVNGKTTDVSYVRAPAGRYYLSINGVGVAWAIGVLAP